MKFRKANILDVANEYDAICFTSNGVVMPTQKLVMGAGVAKAFRDKFPRLDEDAGWCVSEHGNICQIIWGRTSQYPFIVAFPTKHDWKNPSSMELIKRSATQLMKLIEDKEWHAVALPCPGIGHGGIKYEEVINALYDILDERVTIFTL